MAVLDRKELEESPLSDLHAIASGLGIEGYRRLRREKLIDAIVGDSGGAGADDSAEYVYVSPAQIRRCELRPGDQIEGPVRAPRRNERHPSLVRVDKVNGGDP